MVNRYVKNSFFDFKISAKTGGSYSLEYYFFAYKDEKEFFDVLKREDGSASCAYVYPKSVNGVSGELFDAYANDQDFALCFIIKMFLI